MLESNIYVGIDLHKQNFNFIMISSSGERLNEGKFSTSLNDVLEFADILDPRHHVVLEPLGNCFWFINHLRPKAGSIHLANTYKVRLIAESKAKNDRIDARILADLLRIGYLPEVYIPEANIQRWRTLIRHRISLVKDQTRLKNRILGLLNREGHKIGVSDAFGKRGRAQIDSLELSVSTRMILDDYLVSLDLLHSQIIGLNKEIETIGDSDNIVRLLRTFDGISHFTGLAIRAIVGDMRRFKSQKAFAAYTGLVPSIRQSADKIYNGSITKQGVALLRWVLIQAVPHARRKSEYLNRLYERVLHRTSTGKAKVAVAHALSRIIYHVWIEGRPYYR